MTWVAKPGGQNLAVRLDVPVDGRVSGALVLVPSVGRESVVSFRTMRAVARLAADNGLAAVSLWLTGDGDSGPLPDHADPVQTWVEDVETVIAWSRGLVGDRPVHVVGLRLGAALLGLLARERAGETRLQWEPVSGRTFLSRHKTIRRMTIRIPALPHGVELAGTTFTEAQAAAIARLRAPSRLGGDAADGTTLRFEPDREVADRIASTSPHFAQVPHDSIRQILTLLGQADPAALESYALCPQATFTGPQGPVVERFCELGPHRLPAVMTQPMGTAPTHVVLFTAMGAELRCGPGNLWVDLARSLAASGVLCVRADRRLIGEALDPYEPTEPRPYTAHCVQDIVDTVTQLRSSTGLEVSGVGICSGAWALLRASTRVRLRSVVSINNIDWDPDPEAYDDAFYEGAFRFDLEVADPSEVSAQTRPAGWRANLEPWIGDRFRDLRYLLGVRFPWLRARLRGEERHARLRWLLGQVPPGLCVTLVHGPKEASRTQMLHGDKDIARLRRAGHRIDVTVLPALDHSALSAAGRAALTRELTARLGAPSRIAT